MRFIYSLFAIMLVTTLIGCGSSGPEAGATSQNSPADENEHGHEHEHDEHGQDHDGHGHDEHGHDEHGHEQDDHDHEHDDHEGGEQPESFGEAVEQLKAMGGKITKAFAKGEPDDVHDDLHKIGHLIESLPELAKKDGKSSEQQGVVKEAVESLMDAFGELDGTLHGGDPVEVDDVSKEVSTQIKKLESVL